MTNPVSKHSFACFSHPRTFPSLIKHASTHKLLKLGLSLHNIVIIFGLSFDSHISSSLLNFYSKCNLVHTARKVFDAMPIKNIVPWSTMIAAYSNSGDHVNTFFMYRKMISEGIHPNSITFLGMVSGFSQLDHLECVHTLVLKNGFSADLVLSNCMINMYARLGRLDFAQSLFDTMAFKDIVSWNSIILAYSRIGEVKEVLRLFECMRVIGECPNSQTYGSFISSIIDNGLVSIRLGESVHSLVIHSGFQFDMQIVTALVSFYLKFGCHEKAFIIFDYTLNIDAVLWTAMISGLVQSSRADNALSFFKEMINCGVIPTTATMASVLSACAQFGLYKIGASFHGFIVRSSLPMDVQAKNSLVSMYAKCGYIAQSVHVFELIKDRDLVSWNSLISGCVQNALLEDAFVLFRRMQEEMHKPDNITIISLLQGCASSGALMHGKSAHAFTIKCRLNSCISLDTSLVDMYLKCGDVKTAQKCFDSMLNKDLVTWSAIIDGYGANGLGEKALHLYSDFINRGLTPNDVMCMSVLSACNHSGLVVQGLQIFHSMKEFDIKPRLEHCACIVDLLCKAGRVEEAVHFTRTMPIKANADVLGIVLDGCRMNGYGKVAEMVANEIIATKPEKSGTYVQLAHGYAALNRWDSVGQVWVQMRSLGLRKTPGWSSVECNGRITTFYADSTSHFNYEGVVLLLKLMEGEMVENDDECMVGSLVQE